MSSKDEPVRAAIAEQASEWFVANDEAPLSAEDAAALVAWLRASPVHIEEFLAVAGIARDLRLAGSDPELSMDTLLERARGEREEPTQSSATRLRAALRNFTTLRWQPAAIAAAALAVIAGAVALWTLRPGAIGRAAATATLSLATRHGEQQTYHLTDGSVLHLNTDSAITVTYGPAERLVALTAGEADFEVIHDPRRPFRVLAGPAAVIDLGTRFDVRLQPHAAVVTVIEGRVAVEPALSPGPRTGESGPAFPPPGAVRLSANEQLSVVAGQWPARPKAVDALRTIAWLDRQIEFDHEPLARVAAEFNRYSAKPVEITAPKLRALEVSGVFSTDDPEEFVAFLRSLAGVRVDVTPTRILVSQN